MARRVIQITSHFDDGGGAYKPCSILVALCDDGSMWERGLGVSSWKAIDDVPEPTP